MGLPHLVYRLQMYVAAIAWGRTGVRIVHPMSQGWDATAEIAEPPPPEPSRFTLVAGEAGIRCVGGLGVCDGGTEGLWVRGGLTFLLPEGWEDKLNAAVPPHGRSNPRNSVLVCSQVRARLHASPLGLHPWPRWPQVRGGGDHQLRHLAVRGVPGAWGGAWRGVGRGGHVSGSANLSCARVSTYVMLYVRC